MPPLRATVNCDMGEGYSLYTIGDDEGLMKTIHLANIACGFHASDPTIMGKTVKLAKMNGVRIGAHPSLPDRQGFGRREMQLEPDELKDCFIYQVGALNGFAQIHGLSLNHIKPHGAVYGQTARSMDLARAVVSVARSFGPHGDVGFLGLAGTCHEEAAKELGVPFIAEWFADMEYSPEGRLLITKVHAPVSVDEVAVRVRRMLDDGLVTTQTGTVHIGSDVTDVSICVHSDTPGAVEIATTVKRMVDESNRSAGYS